MSTSRRPSARSAVSAMPKFTVESPFEFGDRVRASTGVEFVIMGWWSAPIRADLTGVPVNLSLGGPDDEGIWHSFNVADLTLVPPAPEETECPRTHGEPLYRQIDEDAFLQMPIDFCPACGAPESEAVIARHKR